jgi:hypothetical protein
MAARTGGADAIPPERDDHTLTVRISGQLRDVLYEAATESRHSLNSIVTIFCEQGLAAQSRWPPKGEPVKRKTFWRKESKR